MHRVGVAAYIYALERRRNPSLVVSMYQHVGSIHYRLFNLFYSSLMQGIDAFILAYTKEIPNIYSGYSYKNTNSGPPMDDSEKITSPLNCTNGWTCEHRFPPHQWIVKFFTNYVQGNLFSKTVDDEGTLVHESKTSRARIEASLTINQMQEPSNGCIHRMLVCKFLSIKHP